MKVEEKGPVVDAEFFREVTLRICGSLEIGRALQSCLDYVRTVMPADELVLSVYEPEHGSLRVVATASEGGARPETEEVVLQPMLRKEIEQAEKHARVRMATDAHQDPILGNLAHRRKWPPSSIIVNRLIIEGSYVGALSVRATGTGKYTKEHLRLWGLINEPAAVALANSERYRELSIRKDLLADDRNYLQNELRNKVGLEVIGADFGLRDVMESVRNVAPLLSHVLLIGETGTGKEVIANAIHSLSSRSFGPMIKVNCGAIPETLIDSELFGHEKGAFTGALSQKRGRFERAHGGTIFLDEVGELPLHAQTRFLRVLQEKEIERVGGSKTIRVDVRIISATNRKLEELVAQGRFREDLYFRLGVFPIVVPPLRQRKGDIPALVQHFILKKSREMVLPSIPSLARGAIDDLLAYDWPGNVRELENAVERAIILSMGKPLTFDSILNPGTRTDPGDLQKDMTTLREMESRHICKALELSHGRIEGKGGAAELLAINPATLRHRMRKLKIPFGKRRKG
ncbi:MAG: Formate hydrogenlyase transcriptional activator [Syntrophorhabdaceae bacterium PtaU1.Bin034]|nr:MAG: Formate hydrogenlyase transcriptional activator [Syntrophorhabdaceae bacterium PtaU1.Bin034]